MIINRHHRTFFRFVSVGVANTVVGLASIFSARAMGLSEVAANAMGYAMGIIVSFGLNRHWTFRQRGSLLQHVFRFATVIVGAWLVNIAALLGMMYWGVSAVLAQVGSVLPYTLVCYIGCRHWAFAGRPKSAEGG